MIAQPVSAGNAGGGVAGCRRVFGRNPCPKSPSAQRHNLRLQLPIRSHRQQPTVSAISNRDYALVQGCLLSIGLTYVLVNLLTDVAYRWVNPRMRS